MTVNLHNGTDEIVAFWSASIVETFPAKVNFDNSIAVPLTPYGKLCARGLEGSFNPKMIELQKGYKESSLYSFPIDKFYKMTKSGKYTMSFSVEIEFGMPPQEFVIQSNEIEIAIVEKTPTL